VCKEANHGYHGEYERTSIGKTGEGFKGGQILDGVVSVEGWQDEA